MPTSTSIDLRHWFSVGVVEANSLQSLVCVCVVSPQQVGETDYGLAERQKTQQVRERKRQARTIAIRRPAEQWQPDVRADNPR